MRFKDGRLQFSPSDVGRYLDGQFAAWMDRYYHEAGEGSGLEPDADSPEDRLVQAYCHRHEQAHLAGLLERGVPVTTIPPREEADDALRLRLTREAMARGDQVIYQAALEAGDFFGFADFLHRRDHEDGTWSYEPWDTKLARSVKPKFIVQLCAYADMLATMQGSPPARAGAVLGNQVSEEIDLTLHWHTWLHLKEQFLEFQRTFNQDEPPDPSLEREHGRWSTRAQEIFARDDLTIQVAGISLGQVTKLRKAQVTTMAGLAQRTESVHKLAPGTLDRLRLQAQLQIRSRGRATPEYQVVIPGANDPPRGLALLPPESPGDVYFDIEGFPFAQPNGLEYLLGAVIVEDGATDFRDWWAHDEAGERKAFESFMDWACERYRQYPDMHVYRYSAYEVTALKRLAMRYGSREEELDAFLKRGVFVDLHTVLRQGVAVGTPSYSLKDVEALYLPPREGDVVSAMGSVVAYDDWLASGEPGDWQHSPRLAAIRSYNKVDCESTLELARWLRERQRESGIEWIPPKPELEEKAEEPGGATADNIRLAQQLRERASGEASAGAAVTRLVAALAEYHRREDKPAWWEYFRRQRMEEDELTDDLACLAGLTRSDKAPWKVKRSEAWEFTFDADQDSKVALGSDVEMHHDPKPNVEVINLDAGAGRIVLKTTADATAWPERVHLVPKGPRSSSGLSKAVLRFASEWTTDPGARPAIADLLHRRAPRFRDRRAGRLVPEGGDVAACVTELVRQLDDSVLCIQGPPGTGKSSVSARVIASLLEEGKKVAVTGQSHRVIINLMDKVHGRLQKGSISVPVIKVGGEGKDREAEGAVWVEKGREAVPLLGDGGALVGVTVYGLAYKELADCFDYVFIDEAGQYALANAVITGLAARNIVLVGDQNQLPQVVQGVHPDGSGASVLEHMLAGQETVAPDFGVLLDTTWRLHPRLCDWISKAFYGGRLHAAPHTATARVEGASVGGRALPEAGLVYLPVPHHANVQSSEEEVAAITALVQGLVGRRFRRTVPNERPEDRPLRLEDVLLVAPYNMQVRQLAAAIPGAKVASVDKFQGQQAPVVIVSMCASTLDEVPRGAGFLLDPNRLNVAVSRAQALALVVASPSLLRVRCRSVQEMELMDRHCWLTRVGALA